MLYGLLGRDLLIALIVIVFVIRACNTSSYNNLSEKNKIEKINPTTKERSKIKNDLYFEGKQTNSRVSKTPKPTHKISNAPEGTDQYYYDLYGEDESYNNSYLTKKKEKKNKIIYRVPIGAWCCDGTRSDATGRGACSHHGGVCEWIYE